MVDLVNSLNIAASGMHAQSERLRVVAENIANADSLANKPGESPYRRKIITFKNALDKEIKADVVEVDKIGYDKTDFNKRYEPGHPAADADGYVLTPNVNPIIEMVDMREARRGYEANLNVVEMTKGMLNQTINLLR